MDEHGAWRSERVQPLLRSDLAGLPAYKAGARPPRPPAGTTAYALASNESPDGPLPAALEAMVAAVHSSHRYPDPGNTALVAALAEHCGVPADAIVLGTGSVAICQQIVSAAAGPGDEVLFAWRSFEAYPIVTAIAGATAVTVPLTTDARHDMSAMASAVTPRTRVVFLCTPNNPTGPALTAAEVERFLTAVPDHVLVVLDEAYREYVTDAAAVDGIEAARRHGNLVTLRTFSKAFGLAGVRVGYGIAPPALARRLRAVAMPFGVSRVAEAGAVASLTAVAQMRQRVAATVAERERVATALRSMGWPVPAAQGNFVWLPLPERTEHFVASCAAVHLTVRGFPGEGVRVSVAEPAANSRFLEVAAAFGPPALRSSL